MNAREIDEDALDPEALQAQIDLSMSFAQNLVSSWMEPHKFPTNSRKKDLEKELTEYMRRPPRLGVGASIPEGHQSTSREAARLKGKLAGSKRSREEDEVASSKQASDEEGESRAVAIKKKARPDPFDVVHGKKKKKQKTAEETIEPQAQSKDDSSGEVEDILLNATKSPKPNGLDTESTPVKSKKKRKKAAQLANGVPPDTTDVPQGSEADCLPASPSVENKPVVEDAPLTPQRHPGKSFIRVLVIPSHKRTGKEIAVQVSIDVSLTITPRSAHGHRKALPPEFANLPLLNLTGPPSDPESDADLATGAPSTSPKKKRKRRKKKKSLAVPSTPDDSTPTNQTIPAQ
ncbi:hypothetical protein BDZ97DRAFT_1915420 [Flammula alnicola]|nr:hypothetical protein BDZ97DRAFT_1915420 [Flammula alnicola]